MAESSELIEKLEKVMAELVMDTLGVVKKNTPPGELRDSIIAEQTKDGWIIGTNKEYAPYVELDTVPHKIRARNKKALMFEIGKGMRLAQGRPKDQANIVFAKEVNHPGTKGSHMFLKGLKYFEKEYPLRIKDIK